MTVYPSLHSIYHAALYRRRSLQLHYAACECKPTKCPKAEENGTTPITPQYPQANSDNSKPHYFDCDPSCVEAKYWYYKKGELLVAGREHGEGYI